jgi:hypothetical protein
MPFNAQELVKHNSLGVGASISAAGVQQVNSRAAAKYLKRANYISSVGPFNCKVVLRHNRQAAPLPQVATVRDRGTSSGAVSRLKRDGVRFQQLVKQWKSAIGPTSTAIQMAMHPAYQQIIGMGPSVIPFLLRELQREPDHWFWAFRAITHVDPVPESDRGDIGAMTQAWLNWGRGHGYLA